MINHQYPSNLSYSKKLKIEYADIPLEDRPLAEADTNLVNNLQDIVNKLRKLEMGEYVCLVCAYETDSIIPIKILGFEFTLFESDINEIFKNIEQYKYGFGVHLLATDVSRASINIRVMEEKRAIDFYNKS